MIACPHCAAEHKQDPRNVRGSTELCVVCGGWMITLAPGIIRGPTREEHARIESLPAQMRIKTAWLKTQRQCGMIEEDHETAALMSAMMASTAAPNDTSS